MARSTGRKRFWFQQTRDEDVQVLIESEKATEK